MEFCLYLNNVITLITTLIIFEVKQNFIIFSACRKKCVSLHAWWKKGSVLGASHVHIFNSRRWIDVWHWFCSFFGGFCLVWHSLAHNRPRHAIFTAGIYKKPKTHRLFARFANPPIIIGTWLHPIGNGSSGTACDVTSFRICLENRCPIKTSRGMSRLRVKIIQL